MKPVLAIIIKEIKLLLRDPGGLIMLFILPASFIFILSIALQGTFSSIDTKEKMEILVVNNDTGNTGEKMIKGIEDTGYFKVITQLNNQKVTLEEAKSELFKGNYKIIINIPANTSNALDFKQNETIEVIVDPVLSNEFAASITNSIQNFVFVSIITNITKITQNVFNDITKQRVTEINNQLSDLKKKEKQLIKQKREIASVEMGDQAREIFAQLSNESITEIQTMIASLNKQLDEYNNASMDDQSTFRKNVGLKVNQLYYSSDGSEIFPNSVQQNVPGWTIFALFWIVQVIAINIITERQSGSFKRVLISPISSFQFTIGKITPFFIINLIQAIVMFCIGIFILPLFGCPQLVIKNIPGLLLLTFSISCVAISFGLFMSSITNSLFVAASVSASIIIIMTVLGGIMVPKFVMPAFMQQMSFFIPHGWALDGYLNILVKNYSTIQVLPNIAVLLGFAAVFFIISLLFSSKYKKGF